MIAEGTAVSLATLGWFALSGVANGGCRRPYQLLPKCPASYVERFSIGYWLPTDEPLKGKTLVYLLAFPSREAATKSWADFRNDPEWKKVSAASEANGKIVEKVDSIFLQPTDFSKIK